jgi:signal transduction histidine kinase
VRAILEPLDLDFLSQEMPGALAESREGLARVTEIVRAMKDYAHPGSGRADVEVNRAISSTVQVCRNEWKYQAVVRLELDPAAGTAPCFEGELKQVILNMIVNAAQAIAEDRNRGNRTGLGTITIATRREVDHLIIRIADDGPGMDENVRRRAFDPFFTTKDVGKGTGQGLSLAHSVIVTKHQGRIDLESVPGQGTTFTLHLPLHAPDTPDA